VDETEVGKSNTMNEIIFGYNSKSSKDKVSRITNENREGIDLLTERRDEFIVEPLT
jgi:hypothetical protein